MHVEDYGNGKMVAVAGDKRIDIAPDDLVKVTVATTTGPIPEMVITGIKIVGKSTFDPPV